MGVIIVGSIPIILANWPADDGAAKKEEQKPRPSSPDSDPEPPRRTSAMVIREGWSSDEMSSDLLTIDALLAAAKANTLYGRLTPLSRASYERAYGLALEKDLKEVAWQIGIDFAQALEGPRSLEDTGDRKNDPLLRRLDEMLPDAKVRQRLRSGAGRDAKLASLLHAEMNAAADANRLPAALSDIQKRLPNELQGKSVD